jgi:hypothetical protein
MAGVRPCCGGSERHGLPFVDYLLAVRWGGFPRHAHKTGVRDFVAEMVRDMEPF